MFLKSPAPLRLCVKILFVFLIASNQICFSQNPAPALPQTKSILLAGATAHIGTGKVIENAVIGFKEGKINLVADATLYLPQQGAYDTIINVNGKQIYPGFIATNTTIGISEI